MRIWRNKFLWRPFLVVLFRCSHYCRPVHAHVITSLLCKMFERIVVSLALAYMFRSRLFVSPVRLCRPASTTLNRSTVAIAAYQSLCARQLFKLSSVFKQQSSNTLIFAAEYFVDVMFRTVTKMRKITSN